MPNKHKLYESKCVKCGKIRFLERTKLRDRCRECSSRINAKKNHGFGDKNPNWRGGRTKHSKGYIYIKAPGHPRENNGYVLEHVIVAEIKIGRPLFNFEIVHHMNGIRDDNRQENIEIMTRSEHTHFHALRRNKSHIT